MARFVIDASVAIEYLLRSPLGLRLTDLIDTASLSAPEMLDAEVMSALRRFVLQGRLDEFRARAALDDLGSWPIDRVSHRLLLRLAWEHRHNMSVYDALYVATARLQVATLLTADGRLSRAPGLGVTVQNVRLVR